MLILFSRNSVITTSLQDTGVTTVSSLAASNRRFRHEHFMYSTDGLTTFIILKKKATSYLIKES